MRGGGPLTATANRSPTSNGRMKSESAQSTSSETGRSSVRSTRSRNWRQASVIGCLPVNKPVSQITMCEETGERIAGWLAS